MRENLRKYAEEFNSELHGRDFRTDFFARFVVIWTLISRIPLRRGWWPDTVPKGNRALSLIPLAGGILGLLTGAVISAIGCLGVGNAASVWGGALFYALAGWSLHLDGWGDLWDGLGSGRSGDDLRAVMKDSRLGAYGAIGLILAFGLWTSLLESADASQYLVVCMTAAASGRYAICAAALYGRYPWDTGMGKGWVDTFSGYDFFTASVCMLVFMPFAPIESLLSVLLAYAVGYYAARWMNKRLGGVNGDVLGSVAVAAELLSIMVFAL